jgi:hypothetical protein
MSNSYLDYGLRMASCRVRERKKKEMKRLKHNESIDAIVDFASNLFKVLDGSGISILAPKPKTSSAAFKSFVTSPKDYNGVIAGNMFRAHFGPSGRGAYGKNSV